MATIKELNEYGELLEKAYGLRTAPLAVKLLTSEDQVPENAYRPKRDDGIHYAQCQAFALSRRDGKTVAMLKEDNWCPAPVTAYGLDPVPEQPGRELAYDCLEPGKNIGILTAPLKGATYEPDVILSYPTTNQLRSMLMALPPEGMKNLNSRFFAPSCTYAVVNPIQTQQYWVILPDPGETARAVADDGEMMFSIPIAKMDEYMGRVKEMQGRFTNFKMDARLMQHDFAQPPHYIQAFQQWGLDHDTPGRFKM
ncbi:MAG: DUF169 domain-containing protein [Dehalococcoidales bacterium]|nr:DUF169 domain-containing protein [Dehalococcoidales bacterium]